MSIAVGSFIFLRFFCPAIVSPESEKIVDVPNQGAVKRRFLLLTKVLQIMANGSINTLRWPVLKKKEAELQELNDRIFTFLKIISADDKIEFEPVPTDDMDESQFNFFHNFAYDNWSAIRVEYFKHYSTSEDIVIGRLLAEKMNSFLALVGPPTKTFGYEIPPLISQESNSELYEFMSKHSSRNLDSVIKSSFIRQDVTHDGTHLFIFSYNEFIAIKNLDIELVIYRMFQVASKIWDYEFYIVVDCTGAQGSDMIPEKALSIMADLAPKKMIQNCLGWKYYNVSSSLYPKLVKSLALKGRIEAHSSSMSHSFYSGLDNRTIVHNLGLNKNSLKCYEDIRVKFDDVSLYQPEQNRFIAISLKIGDEFLQLSQIHPQYLKIKDELERVHIHDIIKLENIDDISATETTKVPNEITISTKDGLQFILHSNKYLEIKRLLYFSSNRAINSASDKLYDSGNHMDRLLGQIFNIIFTSLTSSSSEIRSVGFNLYAAATKLWELDVGKKLTPLQEAYFPADNNAFVISISEKLARQKPEMTTEFIGAFFKAYTDSATARQRLSAIMYVSPWISNVYQYVYMSDPENGPDYVAEIIRNFLKVTSLDPLFLSAFNISVWTKLCLQDGICSLLVDEIVLFAIDRDAEGADWKSIIALLTSNPAIEICSAVIKRLREISKIPSPDENGLYSTESSSQWIEMTVLLRISVSLFFDNVLFAEMFLPDIFFIVTMLVDVGTLELRNACHQLLLNVTQSFYSKTSISSHSKGILNGIVANFISPRYKIIFGLGRDSNDKFPSDAAQFTSKISNIENLAESLLHIVDVASADLNEKNVWLARWNRYVIEAGSRDDCILKGRALVLLGVISRYGVNDHMVAKVFEMIAETDEKQNVNLYYLSICSVSSLVRICEGLQTNSSYYFKMFWLAVMVTHTDIPGIFVSGLQFVTKAFEAINSKEKFTNGNVIGDIMKNKDFFGDLISKGEELDDAYLMPFNFDQELTRMAVKGLQFAHFKSNALNSLKTFYLIRYTNERLRVESHHDARFDSSIYVYLLFLFLLMKPEELREMIEEVNPEEEYVILDEHSHLPKSLISYFLSDTDDIKLSLIQATVYFDKGAPNDKSKLRFLQIIKFIGKNNPKLMLRIYSEVKAPIRKLLGLNLPSFLLSELFDVASIAFLTDGFDNNEGNPNSNNLLLEKYNLIGVRNYLISNSNYGDAFVAELLRKPTGKIVILPMLQRLYEHRLEVD